MRNQIATGSTGDRGALLWEPHLFGPQDYNPALSPAFPYQLRGRRGLDALGTAPLGVIPFLAWISLHSCENHMEISLCLDWEEGKSTIFEFIPVILCF